CSNLPGQKSSFCPFRWKKGASYRFLICLNYFSIHPLHLGYPVEKSSMNGAVVENLSNRKLSYILAAAFFAQVVFFLIGGLIAPQPSTSMMNGMRICRDVTLGTSKKWFFIRPAKGCSEEIFDLDEKTTLYTQDTRELVFVAQMPNPKENVELRFSPWFQNMIGVLEMQIEHSTKIPAWKMGRNPELRLEIRMGYRSASDAPDQWHELISTTVTRKLHCSLDAAQ
uniref:Wntless GOLD domain-containing protein n=1 Tax=Romanomermis culicivorax TaxID=13658 RepID=A0A915IGL5_ROMCU